MFKNEYLSCSRLKLYEQCPRAFYFQYVDKGPVMPVGNAAAFGVALHEALQLTYKRICHTEHIGPFPTSELIENWHFVWSMGNLTSVALFAEGKQILQRYGQRQGEVSSWDVIGVEKEFLIDIGPFKIKGYIDRIDSLSDHAGQIDIVDYKSNRELYSADELRFDLQASVYVMVGKELYPSAKSYRFYFDMLRHDIFQSAERSESQLEDAKEYIIALGKRIESDEKWEAKPNANCAYCDHRHRCEAYEKALSDGLILNAVGGLEEITRERERLNTYTRVAYARKAELEGLIKAHIEANGPFESNGVQYDLTPKLSVKKIPEQKSLAK